MAELSDLTKAVARDVVGASFDHLLRLIQPSGRFTYAHLMVQPEQGLAGYNMLRHCGTLWFMLRAVNEAKLLLGPGAVASLGLAVGYAAAKLEQPTWAPGLALVTKGAVKTGGIGLMLVMLEEYRRALPRGLDAMATPAGLDLTIDGLQAYALAQIEGEDFRHKRLIADGTVLPFRSGYYTGEVLLGLLVTGCADPRMVAVAEGLMERRYGLAEQSHWMAYAACEAATRGVGDPGLVTEYLTALIAAILSDDGYRARGMSTPIACRTEALTRFVQLCDRLPGRFPAALRAEALQGAKANLALQLGWYASGQFAKGDGDDKVQIDYIQHNATGFLNLWQVRGP
jgi:hypothetical protein